MSEKLTIFAVCGPTASGKTALSVELAKRYNAEVISCDSMQIYQGMQIGTAKPTTEEMQGVPHHLMGFLEPSAVFSVADYVRLAQEKAEEIAARGHRILLVGGTGLYARAFLRGMPFTNDSCDDAVRNSLENAFAEQGIEPLYEQLKRLDPVSAQQIHPNNTKRVLRALEYCLTTNKPFSKQAADSRQIDPPYRYKMLCLGFQDRAVLYDRINRRVDQMLADGLLEEAERYFRAQEQQGKTSVQAIGYKELFPYFRGEVSLEEAVDKIKTETRRYAKRQLTWFKREENTVWLNVDAFSSGEAMLSAAMKAFETFYNVPDVKKGAE